MELIPAIDLRGGKCVRLYRGDFARETVYADDPVQVAVGWRELGARVLHVVDLDGAREGSLANAGIIQRICEAVSIPVQVGGGIRSLDSIEGALGVGAVRVVLGTLALQSPDLLAEALDRWGDRIAVSLDARDGMLTVKGWQETTTLPATEVASRMSRQGVLWLVYTDIARDGTLEGPNLPGVRGMIEAAGPGARIIASGGVSSVDDLLALQDLGVWGAIAGKALYTGDVDFAKSLRMLAAVETP